MNTRFDIPHSRFNQITKQQLSEVGVKVLVESEACGVHLAVSPDGLQLVFFQGHPEYDSFSLLKEYKREIDRWFNNQRQDYPPFPENYFSDELQQNLINFQATAIDAKSKQQALPQWDEQWIVKQIDNTWRDTTLSTFNNWLGMVYKLTHKDVSLHLMPGIDPENPLDPEAIDPYR
ncbi:MAG: homoserine O-succinyltransferase [Enterobacterales bacterium]|nr:homoserine O-succinyltransferase [Enterobacterales bacterium]